VVASLTTAGFQTVTSTVRAPELEFETTPQAVVVAHLADASS
jgi:hypothetical protein